MRYEVLYEKPALDCFRGILFEIDPDSGAKSICDIVESRTPEFLARCFDWVNEYQFSEIHNNVDFGRAKTFTSRSLKIINSL